MSIYETEQKRAVFPDVRLGAFDYVIKLLP